MGSAERGVAGGALGAAYKAVWYVDEEGVESPLIKTAGEKSTWTGKKEIYRHPYPVRFSEGLQALRNRAARRGEKTMA
jgi:hypothetical protein